MEESKEREGNNNDPSEYDKIIRTIDHKVTGIPENRAYMFTELSETRNLLKEEELIRVSDLKLVVHCYSIQYLIFGKCLALIIFFLGLSHLKFSAYLLMTVFESSGFFGSSRLTVGLNYFFIGYLTLSILAKLSSCLYFYFKTSFSGCLSSSFYSLEDSCELHLRFIIGSVFLASFEVLQIYSTWKLIKTIETLSERKIEEIKRSLKAKIVPRFICLGKLRNFRTF